MTHPPILTTDLHAHIVKAIDAAGGWIGFEQFMALALYTPGLGYYANDSRKFGLMPAGGSDFVTAPELSPRFGQTLARQLAQALAATGTAEVWEFGAGSGALALQILDTLGPQIERYTIVDLSGSLAQRQRERLAAHAGKLRWLTELPPQMRGVVVGNEVLDAMPVKLLARLNGVWHERGVVMAPTLLATPLPEKTSSNALPPEGGRVSLGAARRETHEGHFMFADQRTELRPPLEVAGHHDYLTEIHPQAEGFVRTLADRLETGAVFLLDYGFPEHEYYHPQRSMGTLMCHRGHLADADALADVGEKDITAHVNFTGVALAAQEAGMPVLGYTSQGRFLLNCGLLDGLENAGLPERVMLQKLVNEHEMGELFKVVAFGAKNQAEWAPLGFSAGDRSHTL
ncbi:class I SAM-dependent methyltransferase [Polaromonas jejuensis]|uniref:Class I SAM-dependent methyltransferase n=1 Tax=Polaromonas jejuensis TaxID=457502 RepID=A0ABW0QE33_9BURK|nr:SAM-dependent methyltransferase [Polaromonas jejuensis]